MIVTDTVEINTKGFSDTIDITDKVINIIGRSGIKNGLVTVFCQGSTGTITTIEYEPGVIKDLQRVLEKIAPSNIPYEHDKRWGDGNGFSHVRGSFDETLAFSASNKARTDAGHMAADRLYRLR